MNTAFLCVITQRLMKLLELGPLFTSLLKSRDNLSIYCKWLIICHHLRFAFFCLKYFIRVVAEHFPFFETYLINQNQIVIIFDVVDSNIPIIHNLRCIDIKCLIVCYHLSFAFFCLEPFIRVVSEQHHF